MHPHSPSPVRADLVLVGGGHAHVQVLRRWSMDPLQGVRVTLVVDSAAALYSGMVPGVVAGDYPTAAAVIDLVPLARRAGVRLILAAATGIDPVAHQITLEGRPAIPYDVASLDIGSTVRGLELPGVREHALPTRPIDTFLARLASSIECARAEARVVVVGGGAAGLELAFCVRARLAARGVAPVISLLTDAATVLPDAPARVATRVAGEVARQGILLRTRTRVLGVEPGAVILGGERLEADIVVWATGAAPPALLAASALPRDPTGFVCVGAALSVVDHPDLFAAGDCASLRDAPWLPKSGVYAVRQGPVLDVNLRARLTGGRLRSYRPQRDFLRLLNLGGRRALGTKRGVIVTGRWVWHWKDRIDRRFVRRFQVLTADGARASGFPASDRFDSEPMQCGGCAAKVGASVLERALARVPAPIADASVLLGLGAPDDAAAVRWDGGGILLATLDAFPAFTDDPWLVGRVAAVNAASDVFAKGGRPRHALALVTVPEGEPGGGAECLHQVLCGVRAGLDPLGVSLIGGHTTRGAALFVGLAVTGDLAGDGTLLRLSGARPGDGLILTKALGTGVILAADRAGRAAGSWVEGAFASMLRANLDAARVLRAFAPHAGTDVSGFGLAGHLCQLLRASRVSATIALDRLPILAGAAPLLAAAVRSTFHAQNAALGSAVSVAPAVARLALTDILFDPQTSGGLLVAVERARIDDALAALHVSGDTAAALIGQVEAATPGVTFRVVASA